MIGLKASLLRQAQRLPSWNGSRQQREVLHFSFFSEYKLWGTTQRHLTTVNAGIMSRTRNPASTITHGQLPLFADLMLTPGESKSKPPIGVVVVRQPGQVQRASSAP